MDASRFPATIRSSIKEGSMSLELLAIDLGKRSFHLYGIDADGVIVSRKVSRTKLSKRSKISRQRRLQWKPAPVPPIGDDCFSPPAAKCAFRSIVITDSGGR